MHDHSTNSRPHYGIARVTSTKSHRFVQNYRELDLFGTNTDHLLLWADGARNSTAGAVRCNRYTCCRAVQAPLFWCMINTHRRYGPSTRLPLPSQSRAGFPSVPQHHTVPQGPSSTNDPVFLQGVRTCTRLSNSLHDKWIAETSHQRPLLGA